MKAMEDTTQYRYFSADAMLARAKNSPQSYIYITKKRAR